MENILKRINNNRILLSDGAMGTMLMSKGLEPGDCPEKFNIDRPDVLKEIALEYLEAGADLIQTNTFGASPMKLKDYNEENNTELINKNAVEAVKSVVKGNAYINASVGPSGKILYPFGDVTEEKIYENFHTQVKYLIEAGADIICIETMTDINEAVTAITASKDINKNIPVIATMTFDSTPNGFFTMMGVSIEKACTELKKAGADIIGSNCGNGITNMILIAKEFKKYSDLPIIIQSNAGIPVLQNGKTFFPDNPQDMVKGVGELIKSGVNIIGGCCGTTPEYIFEFRKAIDNYS